MPKQRLFVTLEPYRGKDPKKQRRYHADIDAANRLETFLNERMVEDQPQTMTYFEIAKELRMDKETVHRLLFPVRFGNTGITC